MKLAVAIVVVGVAVGVVQAAGAPRGKDERTVLSEGDAWFTIDRSTVRLVDRGTGTRSAIGYMNGIGDRTKFGLLVTGCGVTDAGTIVLHEFPTMKTESLVWGRGAGFRTDVIAAEVCDLPF